MQQEEKKRAAAEAALAQVEDGLLGVGTGSTVDAFIALLPRIGARIDAAVASSEATAARLRQAGIPVVALHECTELPLYVDGADEANRHLQLIKGGGGALTREKILAAASRRFVCIIDDSKLKAVLGGFPLPVEVIPMAQSFVGRELAKLGGRPRLRAGFTTDNGNCVLDVEGLSISEPAALEARINQIPGVVANGLFAARPADLLLVAGEAGVESLA